jgi:hypothetical protein
MSQGPVIVGEAILLNYPLKLWFRQYEHTQDLMREFQLLSSAGSNPHDVPRRLIEMADHFVSRYGRQIDEINRQRMQAYEAGLTTIESRVPLPAELPELMRPVLQLLEEVDAHCRSGELLTPPRSPKVAALQAWTTSECLAQFDGADPTPWDGPMD